MKGRKRGWKKKKITGEIKEKLMEFFHKIGLYKTHEEKRTILLQKEIERHRKEQRRKELDQEKIKLEESKKDKKPTMFGRLFKVKGQIIEKKAEEKPKEQKIPQNEFEELEEAIRNLGLFKKIEKEKAIKEKPGIFGKFFEK